MGTTFNPHPDESEQPSVRRLEEICDAFKAAWAAGQRPRIEEALEDTPAPERTALLPRLLSLELEVRRSRGEQPTLREYRKRFSEYATQVEEAFAAGKIAHGWRANGAKSTPTPRATPRLWGSLLAGRWAYAISQDRRQTHSIHRRRCRCQGNGPDRWRIPGPTACRQRSCQGTRDQHSVAGPAHRAI